MKAIIWTDDTGRKRRSLIKDNDGPEMAPYGIPAEPPDVTTCLDWTGLQREISDILLENELLTWQDIQRRPEGVTAALNALKRRLIMIYKLDEQTKKHIGG